MQRHAFDHNIVPRKSYWKPDEEANSLCCNLLTMGTASVIIALMIIFNFLQCMYFAYTSQQFLAESPQIIGFLAAIEFIYEKTAYSKIRPNYLKWGCYCASVSTFFLYFNQYHEKNKPSQFLFLILKVFVWAIWGWEMGRYHHLLESQRQ